MTPSTRETLRSKEELVSKRRHRLGQRVPKATRREAKLTEGHRADSLRANWPPGYSRTFSMNSKGSEAERSSHGRPEDSSTKPSPGRRSPTCGAQACRTSPECGTCR